MAVDRLERVNALLRREIGEALYREFPSVAHGLEVGAISVLRVQFASNLRNATVYVSIFGHDHQRGSYLQALAAAAPGIPSRINRDMSLKYTPKLHFSLDNGLAKGDQVLDLLYRMEERGELPSTDAPSAGHPAD